MERYLPVDDVVFLYEILLLCSVRPNFKYQLSTWSTDVKILTVRGNRNKKGKNLSRGACMYLKQGSKGFH